MMEEGEKCVFNFDQKTTEKNIQYYVGDWLKKKKK